MAFKYIAAGYNEDCSRLIKEFVNLQTIEYLGFATLWRKHNFNCIYMGHEEKQLKEFTNEIFQLTMVHINDESIRVKIGGLYILYALYRNQVINPPVQIRISQQHCTIFENISQYAKDANVKSLIYVLSYLIDNAFEYVAFATQFGPYTFKSFSFDTPSVEKEINEQKLKASLIGHHDVKFLEDLKDISSKYVKCSKDVLHSVNSSVPNNNIPELYDEYISCLENFLNNKKKDIPHNKMAEKNNSSVGNKRSTIKFLAYGKRMANRYNIPFVDEDLSKIEVKDSIVIPKKIRRARRIPKEKRRVGRPRKNPLPEQHDSNESGNNQDNDSDYEPEIVRKIPADKRKRGPSGRMSYIT